MATKAQAIKNLIAFAEEGNDIEVAMSFKVDFLDYYKSNHRMALLNV